jgi:ribose/xylose/arabinose/galactoside ABC-type transport system permease subunit
MISTKHLERAQSPVATGFRVSFARLGQGRSGPVVRLARENTALILLIVLVIAGGFLSDVFLTPRNLLNIMWAVSILGIVALGQTTLLITCNFDMSVAFVIGLSGIITVLAQIAGLDLAASMALGLAGGLAVGLVTGCSSSTQAPIRS